MASDLRRRGLLATLLLAAACTTGGDLATAPGLDDVPALSLEVLGQHSLRLRWTASAASLVRLERRINLQGDFTEISGDLPRAQTAYLDEGLEPNTFYGYRLVVFDAFGSRAGTSPAVGGRTAPPPGIELQISTQPGTAPSVDPDGYQLTLAGPLDTLRQPVDPSAAIVLSPLGAGTYQLTLAGLAPQCAPADSLTRTAVVTDQGTETVQHLAIDVLCRNPERGQASAAVTSGGELPDSDGFVVELAGLATDGTLSDTARVFLQQKQVGGAGGTVTFPDLRPGTYAFSVSGLAANCTLQGPQQVSFDVGVLDDVTQAFGIDCPDPGAASRPFVLRTSWNPAAAPAGAPVALDVVLDLTARASQDVAAFETQIRVPTAVLRYDSTAAADLPSVFANQAQPGLVLVSGFTTATPPRGAVRLARLWFTVVGADGASATSQTTHSNTVGGDGATFLDPEIRAAEGTFTVGAGGGGENRPPEAHANGPYSGAVGEAIALSSVGSADPDGSIASYAWTFGDGASGTGAAPTHAYTTAGSYPVTLTVTDNLGLTGSATATVTVSGGGGGGGGGGPCGEGTTAQPYVLCSSWTPATGAPGDAVLLTQAIDLTPDGSQDLVAFETAVVTDPALVRFDSARAGGITNLVVNGSTPGSVRLAGFVTGAGPKGVVTVARVYYTALGTTGGVATQTTLSNFVGTSGALLDSRILTLEDTLAIGGGPGSGGDGGGGGGPPGTSPLDWQTSFGPLDADTRTVPLNLTLDLRSDPAVRLGAWQVTALTWDPAVLSYATTDFAGGTGTVDATDALTGRLVLAGTPGNGGTGLVTAAVVRFVAYAASGRSTTATATLGTMAGVAASGAVDLGPRVVVHDGSFRTP